MVSHIRIIDVRGRGKSGGEGGGSRVRVEEREWIGLSSSEQTSDSSKSPTLHRGIFMCRPMYCTPYNYIIYNAYNMYTVLYRPTLSRVSDSRIVCN